MYTDIVTYSMDGQPQLSKYKLEYDVFALCLNILSPSRIYSSENLNRTPSDHIWWLYCNRMSPQSISNGTFKRRYVITNIISLAVLSSQSLARTNTLHLHFHFRFKFFSHTTPLKSVGPFTPSYCWVPQGMKI